jgi:hypothetical protein
LYYNFDTSDEASAIGATFVYGIYRSRDTKRFKVTPSMWGQIEQGVKSAAKRAIDLNDFIEKLKPKLSCSSVQPRWMPGRDNWVTMAVDSKTGEVVSVNDQGRRVFWTSLLEEVDHRFVLERLYKRTSLIIALVRDRLERERPLESKGLITFGE